ncbi:D-alanyl-D-alanine carboxypeptidase PBP3 [Streptococcus sp.]
MKKIITLLLCLILTLLSTSPVRAEDLDLGAQHAIAIDGTTGKILYEKNSNEKKEVGGISNLLTTYLVYEAIQQGKISLNDDVDISDKAYQLTAVEGISNVPMEARKYKVKDLLTALLVSNANSAAIALAEKVAGNEEQFVLLMKAKLKDWGITDATIVNASGLNQSIIDGDGDEENKKKNTENKLSAYDVAVIAKHLLEDYPEITKITSLSHADFAGIQLESSNYMLENMPNYRAGVDGLKTGNSDKGGISFVASTNQNGIRMITVVIGVEAIDGDPYARFVATANLMNYVSQNFIASMIVSKGETYNNSKSTVLDGKKTSALAVAKDDFIVIERQGSQAEAKITFESSQPSFNAPLKKGTSLGTLTYNDPEPIGRGYIEGKAPSMEMVSEENIQKSFFLKVWWNQFVRYVNEKL